MKSIAFYYLFFFSLYFGGAWSFSCLRFPQRFDLISTTKINLFLLISAAKLIRCSCFMDLLKSIANFIVFERSKRIYLVHFIFFEPILLRVKVTG